MNVHRSFLFGIEWLLQFAGTSAPVFRKRHGPIEKKPKPFGLSRGLSLALCLGLASLSPKAARAACAEDLTRIELVLANVSPDLRARIEPMVLDATQSARRGDKSACNSKTSQILRQLQLPTLAPLALSTPMAARQAGRANVPSAPAGRAAASDSPGQAGSSPMPTTAPNGAPSAGSGPASHASAASGEGATGPTAGSGHPAASMLAQANPQAGDAAHGQGLAQSQCAVCHNLQQGGGARIGPDLFGVTERNIAGASGFDYSPALKAHQGMRWSAAALDEFLKGPTAFAPGTRMALPGIASDTDRRDIIAYLETLNSGGTAGQAR
jgi:cytochrome c